MDGIALYTSNAADRIALRGVRVLACLAGMSQRTTVEQTFVNLEPRAVETVYTFPLPEGAAVCGFEVVTADRVLTGVVDESDRAIERYDDAIADGHGAFLMEQERPDVFTVRAGNLKPGQAATIRLTYVCALERTDKQIRVAFPTTVAPRYVTAIATDPLEAAMDGEALNPPHVAWVPYGLSLRVEVELGREPADVYSPSHAVRVERVAGGRAVVTLAGGVTEMNRDVVLNVALRREHEPSVQLERGGPDGKDYLAVTFVPEFDVDELAEPAPADVVFVLDCSGSMAGESIAQAKTALELCLRSLSPGDTFNVCRFGSSFELMASEPLAYSQATLDRALKYVRETGDLGGTELHPPLAAIFTVPPRPGCVRQLILLTDGQVSNEPAVIELARQHRRHNRLFTFGIGAACSAFLVKGLARATGGAAEFITAGERIDEKVLRTFGRLASPIVSDVSVDWDGCDVQTLAELPPVFDGDVMAVFGRAAGRAPTRVTLSCTTPAGPKRWTVPVGQPADFGGVVPTMWARRTVQSLEEVNALPRARKAGKGREREMLVSLSKQFGLLCSQTTFVAIEHRSVEERNAGQPAVRRVPVQLAAGWGGVAAPAMMTMASRAGGAAPTAMFNAPRSASVVRRRGSSGPTVDRLKTPMDKKPNRSLDKSVPCSAGEDSDVDPTGAPMIRLVNALIDDAVRSGASDIHIEPLSDRVQVRFQIGGHWVDRDRIPLRMMKPLSSRIRIVGGTNVVGPVSGPFKLWRHVSGVDIEWRVTAHASRFGEAFMLSREVGAMQQQPSLHAILSLQTADGWFESNNALVGQGEHRQGAEDVLTAWLGALPHLRVVATAAALIALRVAYPGDQLLWQRSDRKAIRWLGAMTGRDTGDINRWLQAAAADPRFSPVAVP